MLENYTEDNFGVVHQCLITEPVIYNKEYIDSRYHKYPEKCVNMSFLRLGYIVGSIGHIPNSILDVGYGSGDFLNVCKTIIPNCFGNDITDVKLPQNISFVDNILEKRVEVITFFDVLEHFENIDFVKKLMCDFLCISVPWCRFPNDDEWFKNWKHRRPNEHLHHFNEISLVKFLRDRGYEPINLTNLEDSIRKDSNLSPNILTGIFKKI